MKNIAKLVAISPFLVSVAFAADAPQQEKGMGGGMGMPPRSGTSQNPVGRPPGIVSAKEAFGDVGTLPSPDPSLVARHTSQSAENSCSACGSPLRPNAKFCTKCGTKT